MGVRLSEEEAWQFVEAGHTGILTTLRRDGWPIALPVWFVVADRRIYVGTPAITKKVARVRNDERASFLVESGEAWVELAAVHLPVRAHVLDPSADGDEIEIAGNLMAGKYADFRPQSTRLPEATTKHYSSQAIIRLEPAGPPVSWDNARIRLSTS